MVVHVSDASSAAEVETARANGTVPARIRAIGSERRRLYRISCGRAEPCDGRLLDIRPRHSPPPPPPIVACPQCQIPNAIDWPVDATRAVDSSTP